MPPTTYQLERIAYDGPLSVMVACLLGLVIAAVMGVLLYRERLVLGGRTATFFWLLRCAAVAVLIWLLLSPTRVTVERTTIPRSIAVLSDVSASMKTVDPQQFQQHRWQLGPTDAGTDSDVTAHPLALADRATVAAKIAHSRIQAAITAVDIQQADDVALTALSTAEKGIQRVRKHLSDLQADFTRQQARNRDSVADIHRAARTEIVRQADEIQKMLEGEMFSTLAEVAKRHANDQPIDSRKWQEPLPDLSHRMDVVHRELTRLTTIAESLPVPNRAPLFQRGVTKVSDQVDDAARHSNATSNRLLQVDDFLDRWTATLEPNLRDNIRHYRFDEELVEAADSATDALTSSGALRTDIGGALTSLIDHHQMSPLAAVVVLGDMSDNARGDRDPADVAKDLGLPFYILPTGNTGYVRDVELSGVSAPNVVLQGDRVVIEATIRAHQCGNEILQLQLLENNSVLETRAIEIDSATATRRVRIEADAEDIGVHSYVMRVTPLDGELTDENNLQEFQVHVTQDSIRVLVSDEMARYEYRYLTHLLRRDPQVKHDELVLEPRVLATGERKTTGQLPQTADEWGEYDVVLLGDLPPERLTVTSQLALLEFLEKRGGTLVLLAGANYMPSAYGNQPLESILPVQSVGTDSRNTANTDGFRVAMTDEGWRHHALWIGEDRASTAQAWEFVNDNAPIEWLSEFRRPRPSAHSLIGIASNGIASNGDEPREGAATSTDSFLSWQSVGRGRVVFLASPESYRLRFLRGDRLHHRFWGQLLRWAAATDLASGSDRVRIRTERSHYFTDEPIQVTVQLHDKEGDPIVEGDVRAVATDVNDADNMTSVVLTPTKTPGHFTGQLSQLIASEYRIEPSGAAVDALLATPEGAADGATDDIKEENTDKGDASVPTTSVRVRSRMQRELIDTRCDLALAQKLAQATDGQVLPPTAISEVVALTDLSPLVSETTTEELLWPQWYWLAAVFGCLNIEWIIRKWRGLS